MDHYFEVIYECMPNDHLLVKARDVIEAGMKAQEVLSDRGYGEWAQIIEIARTKIVEVID